MPGGVGQQAADQILSEMSSHPAIQKDVVAAGSGRFGAERECSNDRDRVSPVQAGECLRLRMPHLNFDLNSTRLGVCLARADPNA